MANEALVLGTTTPVIGFATTAPANVLRETEDRIETGERDELIGENDTTLTEIYTDLGVQVGVNGTMLSGLTLPEIGAALELGGVSGYVMEARISRTTNLNRARLMIEKPNSISAIS